MKEVLAFIRPNRMNATKKALETAGITSLHAKECLGRGKGLVDFTVLKGAELGYEEAISQLGSSQRLIPKRMISCVVPDKAVAKAVGALISANHTGKAGDGKVFIMPISESIRVRTGESGDAVLDEA
jgi:nitrogen regulatory protein PII 2